MKRKTKILICQISASIFILIFLCEYLIYYIVLLQCSWPELTAKYLDESNEAGLNEKREPVKALFLADIHLVSLFSDRHFDRLRRERQMYKSFQAAVSLLDPEVIFILGDLFHEGSKVDDHEFTYFLNRLIKLFKVHKNKQIYFIAGNHDVGFHYDIRGFAYTRFIRSLQSPPVQLLSIRGNHFVLLNSMVMEGDGCFLCKPASAVLDQVAKKLKCTKANGKCPDSSSLGQFSRPILLQHFPMYRESDRKCFAPNVASKEELLDFYESWDCLSKDSTEMLLDLFNPRLIVGGHTHHDCHVIHRKDIHEYTIPSFNPRFKNDPSVLMGVFLPGNYSLSKCYVPQESVIIFIYCAGLCILLIFAILSLYPVPYDFNCKRFRF